MGCGVGIIGGIVGCGITDNNILPWTPLKYEQQVGEDDVFMTLDLPLETTESRTNSEGSGSHSKCTHPNVTN